MKSLDTPRATQVDFVIIGAGIAGASAAYWLAPHGRVIVLERESQPGYHATGRSAAMFMESYGSPQVRALTRASRDFLKHPPPGFCEHPLLTPRGALIVGTRDQQAELLGHWDVLRALTPSALQLNAQQALARVPILRSESLLGAVEEPDAADIDVHALHQGYLRGMRQAGGVLVCDAPVSAIERAGDDWLVLAGGALFQALVILNAAGAWVDEIAALAGAQPLGIEPRRRSAFLFAPPDGVAVGEWPMVISASEDWYFKPDAGMLLGSPANADPVPAQDVQPEELDIALAIHKLEEATTMRIRRPLRSWAGLRSFVPDGDLVAGYGGPLPGFFWVAAQGGYGIQTSPAMGQTCAALARGLPVPEPVARFGVTSAMLSPARLGIAR